MSPVGLRALRKGVARLRLPWRGVIEVTGDDRVRWLDGMLTNAVADLAAGGERSGCYALALTRQGRVVADVQVVAREGGFLLDLEADAIPALLEHLEGFLVADDVTLRDRSADWTHLAVEGPGAAGSLAQLGISPPPPDGVLETRLGGAPVLVVSRSLSGCGGLQLLAPAAGAEGAWEALAAVVSDEADAEALELVRIEQGVPRLGRDLGPDVLPGEVRLEGAVSETKGCYTGQEVVARMRSRDRVSQLLVGLRFDDGPPAPGTVLEEDGRRRGEVTSAARSDRFGAIGLGFVARALASGGTVLMAAGREARVVELPFAPPGAAS